MPSVPPPAASATSTLTLTQPVKRASSSHLSLENEKKSAAAHVSLPSVASGVVVVAAAEKGSLRGGDNNKSPFLGSRAKHLEAKTLGLGSGDSGLYSQLSLDNQKHSSLGLAKSMEILEPGVKELLSTCAKYNIDQDVAGIEGGYSAEILEEIRHVEALETIRSNSNTSAPNSPMKNCPAGPGNDSSSSSPPSPLPLPKPLLNEDSSQIINGAATPQSTRRARLGHPTVVSVSGGGGGGQPVTTLLPTTGSSVMMAPPPYSNNSVAASKLMLSSRDPSPHLGGSVELLGGGSTSSGVPPPPVINVPLQTTTMVSQERVPVLPVLTFVFAYILLGAVIFSAWEKWSLLEGAYFSFITLTTIGFGDFVPGDAVLNDDSEHGQAKLIIACIYVLMGLAVVAMSINLVQEEIIGKFRQLAKDMGIIDDDDDEEIISS